MNAAADLPLYFLHGTPFRDDTTGEDGEAHFEEVRIEAGEIKYTNHYINASEWQERNGKEWEGYGGPLGAVGDLKGPK